MTPQTSSTKRRGSVCHPSTQKRRSGSSGADYFGTQSLRNGDGCCILPGEIATREPRRYSEKAADSSRITALRRELAQAEQALRARTRQESTRVAQAERAALREACDSCRAFDRIRPNASARLEAIRAASPERFRSERQLAEIVLRKADDADAAYTVIGFAKRGDRLRYLRGGDEREAVIREAMARGGVYTEGYGGRHFKEIVR